jgi:hypothetical protein
MSFDQLLEFIRDAEIVGYGKRSKGLPETRVAMPARPQPFAAGAKEIIFKNSQGVTQNVLFDAVGKLSNLTPIIPGETLIPGACISWNGQDLDRKQGERLLGGLYSNFARRQSDQQLQRLQDAVNMASAIVYNGSGQDMVDQGYTVGVANVLSLRTLFPETYP